MSDQEEESKWKQVLEGNKKLTKKQKQKRKKEFQMPKPDGGTKRRLKNPYDNAALQEKEQKTESSSEDQEEKSDSDENQNENEDQEVVEKIKKIIIKRETKGDGGIIKGGGKEIVKVKGIKGDKEKRKTQENKEKNQWKDTLFILLFFVGFIVCAGILKYYEEKYRKFEKYNLKSKFGKDLYEILQLDSQASSQEIKKSYKKLVVIWHPDKNPNCGQKCNDKFQEITDAYEILSNEEKRRSYDESSGAWAHIRSKAITLTEHNFQRLVEDSNDVWIIEAYEDGNSHCERIAAFWEELIQEFNSVGVQFGRINIETQKSLIKMLPFHVVITPTIFSLAKGYEPDIYIYDYMHLLPTLKQFVIDSIHNEVKLINLDEFKSWFEEIQEGNAEPDQVPELFLQNLHNNPSPYFKYNAIKYKNTLKFLSNQFGFQKKVQYFGQNFL